MAHGRFLIADLSVTKTVEFFERYDFERVFFNLRMKLIGETDISTKKLTYYFSFIANKILN